MFLTNLNLIDKLSRSVQSCEDISWHYASSPSSSNKGLRNDMGGAYESVNRLVEIWGFDCKFKLNVIPYTGETIGSTEIGGGWTLSSKWYEKEGEDGKKERGFKRVYPHEEGVSVSRRGSVASIPGGDGVEGDYIHAAALVTSPTLHSKQLQHPIGPAMVHPGLD